MRGLAYLAVAFAALSVGVAFGSWDKLFVPHQAASPLVCPVPQLAPNRPGMELPPAAPLPRLGAGTDHPGLPDPYPQMPPSPSGQTNMSQAQAAFIANYEAQKAAGGAAFVQFCDGAKSGTDADRTVHDWQCDFAEVFPDSSGSSIKSIRVTMGNGTWVYCQFHGDKTPFFSVPVGQHMKMSGILDDARGGGLFFSDCVFGIPGVTNQIGQPPQLASRQQAPPTAARAQAPAVPVDPLDAAHYNGVDVYYGSWCSNCMGAVAALRQRATQTVHRGNVECLLVNGRWYRLYEVSSLQRERIPSEVPAFVYFGDGHQVGHTLKGFDPANPDPWVAMILGGPDQAEQLPGGTQPNRYAQSSNRLSQSSAYTQSSTYTQPSGYTQASRPYTQNAYTQSSTYTQPSSYTQSSSYGSPYCGSPSYGYQACAPQYAAPQCVPQYGYPQYRYPQYGVPPQYGSNCATGTCPTGY
jgi:hypothetical protein